jgi:hypothetical protein
MGSHISMCCTSTKSTVDRTDMPASVNCMAASRGCARLNNAPFQEVTDTTPVVFTAWRMWSHLICTTYYIVYLVLS